MTFVEFVTPSTEVLGYFRAVPPGGTAAPFASLERKVYE